MSETSGCVEFSTCRIQFIPNDQKRANRNYSERSLIELRQYDYPNYVLRALDIDNKKEEIFHIPLEKDDQYKRGKSVANPDEILNDSGTFYLWLNAASRTRFHEALTAVIEEIKLLNPESSFTPKTSPDAIPKKDPRLDYQEPKPRLRHDYQEPKPNPRHNYQEQTKPDSRLDYQEPKPHLRRDYQEQPKPDPRRDYQEQPKPDPRRDYQEQLKPDPRRDYQEPKPDPRRDYQEPKPTTQSNRNDILADVYQLGQHIRQGSVDDAANLAKKLSRTRVRLQANLGKHRNEERPIQIRVKIDSNDEKINRRYNNDLIIDVYPSTTIRELRTVFEYSEEFQPSNQYFFVNGHLAHGNSTMSELDVLPNSLFVLFIIQQ